MRAKPAPINTEGTTEPAARSFSVGGQLLTAPRAAAGLHLVIYSIGLMIVMLYFPSGLAGALARLGRRGGQQRHQS